MAPAASASSTQPRISHALRAIVAHTRRGSISGAGSARTGSGSASMRVTLVVANQVVDGEQAEPELHELVGRSNRQLVANDEWRVLHVELIAGAHTEIADAIGERHFARRFIGAHDEHADVAAGTNRAAGLRHEREHRRRTVHHLHARILHAAGYR